jgi:ABC-type multidrug transport system ATPase subunit
VEIHAQRVGVDGPHGPLLRPTSFRFRHGELKLVAGEPGTGHTALALALAGRLRPTTGAVLIDGRHDPADLRSRVAVVDAPQVSEPDEGLRLATVVAEELALAGEPAGRRAVNAWLAKHRARTFAGSRLHTVPAAVRTRLLVWLAAARPGVQVLVLDCPDRHTNDVHSWWDLAQEHADRGPAVVVLSSISSARLLGAPTVRLGAREPAPTATGRVSLPSAGTLSAVHMNTAHINTAAHMNDPAPAVPMYAQQQENTP